MASIETLFATRIYRAELSGAGGRRLLGDLDRACRSIASDDGAGRRWCVDNGYPGYTSYASLDDLPGRFPEFADLEAILDRHAAAFADLLELDLGDRRLVLDNIWINVLDPGGFHSGHIHPHSVLSGTIYIAVPKGAGALRFEDPRLAMMMASPLRRPDAAPDNRPFHTATPKPGTILMWESWLRHEVLASRAREPRVSVSFNYRWG
jgi:uncharacterized protein (TIGR02466 family)